MLLVSACGDPLRDVPRLSDVDLAEDVGETPAVVAPDPDERTSFLGRFLNRDQDEVANAEAQADLAIDTAIVGLLQEQTTEVPASTDTLITDAEGAIDATDPAQVLPEPRRVRLWPFGRRNRTAQTPTFDENPSVEEAPTLAIAQAPAAQAPAQRRGLFGRRKAVHTGPDAQTVEQGARLPFGEIATVCGVSTSDLGTQVGRHPDNRSGFRIYDTIPNASAPRTYYITGFDDGCARQFTANIVTPGGPLSHEFVRYEARPNAPMSATDLAYEQVKNSVCRSSNGKPCGAQLLRLESNTIFLSVYERFGTNSDWVEILLHDGRVLAVSRKDS